MYLASIVSAFAVLAPGDAGSHDGPDAGLMVQTIAVTDRASWKLVAHLGDLDCFEMDRMTVQAVGFQCSWWSGVATGIVSDNRCRLFCVQATAGPVRCSLDDGRQGTCQMDRGRLVITFPRQVIREGTTFDECLLILKRQKP